MLQLNFRSQKFNLVRSAARVTGERRQFTLEVNKMKPRVLFGLVFVAVLLVVTTSAGAVVTITEFPSPTPGSQPAGITFDFHGNLWFTEYNGNKIGRMTPQGVFTEFPITTFFSAPGGITLGVDRNLWFTEKICNKI